ncbi:hypothetical protein FKM82_026901 [Ascaphus truei]
MKPPRSGDAGPSAQESASSWPFFKMMAFLKEQMVPAKTVSNAEAEGSAEAAAGDVALAEDSLRETAASPEPPAKRSKTSDELKQLISLEEKKLEVMSHVFKDPVDEELKFFKSLIPYIKQLGQLPKLMVRQEIQAVVLRAVQRNRQNK